LWALPCTVAAQTPLLDSLQKVLKAEQTDTGRIRTQAAIMKAYWYINADTAIKIGLRLAEEAKAMRFAKEEALCYNNVGVAYDVSGNYPKALEFHFMALRIRDSIKDIAGRADSENNIGEIYKFRGEYDKARQYYLQAVASAQEANDPRGSGVTYVALSEMYLMRKDYTTSLYYSHLAEQAMQKVSEPFWQMQCHNNIGAAQLALKNHAEALRNYQQALEAALQSKEPYIEATALNGIAKVYMETGRVPQAIEHIKKALDLYVSVNSKLEIRDTYLLLSAAYEKIGDFGQALSYYKLVAATQDSLFNDEKIKLMNVIQYSYEIDKKQRQIELLAKDNALSKARSRQQINGILFLAVSLVGAGITALLLYRHAKSRGQLNTALMAQKEQISGQAAELRLANATKDKLFAIIGHDLRGPVGSLGMMLGMLNNNELSRDEFREVSKDIKGQVDTVYTTMENLLIWSRAQMKGIQTVKKIIDMAQIAHRQIGLLQKTAEAKQLLIQNEMADGSHALADTDQMDFVLRNLLANAIKFTPSGGRITLSASKANGWLTLSVKDTGGGIDADVLPKLFTIDHVSTSSSSGSESGTGLGLVMCKEFVENNGGKIWVESEEGQGSNFYFTLAAAL
jgi:two-component system, sensor histidine kinase and response regulator